MSKSQKNTSSIVLNIDLVNVVKASYDMISTKRSKMKASVMVNTERKHQWKKKS